MPTYTALNGQKVPIVTGESKKFADHTAGSWLVAGYDLIFLKISDTHYGFPKDSRQYEAPTGIYPELVPPCPATLP